jgi:hypothetical protein
MTYSDVINKLGQIKMNNLDLINSQIPPVKGDLTVKKTREGDGGSPYTAPPKENPGPFVPAPKRLAAFPQEGGNFTEFGYLYDPDTGDVFINTPDGLINDGTYDVDIHGLIVPLAKQKMMINQDTANLTPKMFTPFDMGVRDEGGGLIPHIITPSIRDAQMNHFKRFIKNSGESTWDLSQGNSPMMIAKKKKKKGLTIYQEKARRDALRDMGDTIYDPDEGRMGGGFDIINDVLGLDEA